MKLQPTKIDKFCPRCWLSLPSAHRSLRSIFHMATATSEDPEKQKGSTMPEMSNWEFQRLLLGELCFAKPFSLKKKVELWKNERDRHSLSRRRDMQEVRKV